MPSGHPEHRHWHLTEQAFRGLLAFLDPDERRAAEHYETIREKLTRFFEWKGCIPGEDYADETIDRVARKIEQGIETLPAHPYLYFHGVAVNVVRERWRKASHDLQPMPAREPALNPFEEERRQSGAAAEELRLGCLQECLAHLPARTKELLTTYHLGESSRRVGARKGLAEGLRLEGAALRVRVYRIRRHLRNCVSRCVSESKAETSAVD